MAPNDLKSKLLKGGYTRNLDIDIDVDMDVDIYIYRERDRERVWGYIGDYSGE